MRSKFFQKPQILTVHLPSVRIELQTSTQIRVEAVENSASFKYINSLLVKETHKKYFRKKDVQHTR
jgi:putative alpha-1,2-mannosidase